MIVEFRRQLNSSGGFKFTCCVDGVYVVNSIKGGWELPSKRRDNGGTPVVADMGDFVSLIEYVSEQRLAEDWREG